jgi:hypothetical protein
MREMERGVPEMPEDRNRPHPLRNSLGLPAGGYARMFPDLEALRIEDAVLLRLANEMASPLTVGENPNCPAGYTYFGQFIAHDISLMCKTGNRRRAALDLECVYGSPQEDWSGLYRKDDAGDLMFAFGLGGDRQGGYSKEPDLPRRADGMPGIPDPRNDFHTIISQLHLTFMRLHNRVAGELRKASPEKGSEEIFSETRRKVCWLYQWLIVNDFLRRLCDQEIMKLVWPGGNAVDPQCASFISQFDQKIPYEFALAGYRFGHSMVRPAYRLNDALPPRPIFHRHGDTVWNADLRGHRELLVRWSVQWDLFLGHGNPQLQYSCRMSPTIAPSLGRLPGFTIAEDEELLAMVNLVERTLRSGNGLLPCGQAVAGVVLADIFPRLGLPPFSVLDPDQSDPLWHYVLKEAAQEGGGCRLGPVGSWIVASTISSILTKDNSSFVHAGSWQPDLPVEGNAFELVDLIRYAGSPITQADWESYVEGRAAA